MSKRLLLLSVIVVVVSAVIVFFVLRRQSTAQAITPTSGHEAHQEQSEADEKTPRGEVTLDTRRQQLIGVRTVRVQRSAMAPEIRAAGTLTYDETRQAEINTRVDGWIRDLYADYTGRPIRRGEPLFTLYSPDLVATQNEYLLALRGQAQESRAEAGNLREYSDRLVDAARERLLRLDMTAADIDELQRTGRAAETITFRSPVSGVILEKPAVRGMRVMAGQMLYRIADLSTLWVEAEVYETDLPRVRTGTRASVTLQGYPDRPFAGRITYIYPSVTEQTRTVRVRMVLPNPEGILKPNMLATVTLQTPQSNALVLPADALVDTGRQQLVFIAQGDGRFTPKDVRIGRRSSGEVEVLSGLKEGDEVAASATFFLDSESQLRGALQNYQSSASTAQPGGPAAPALDIAFRTEPDPTRTGEDTFIVTVKDGSGQPLGDADVTVVLFMPAMPAMNMPASRVEAKLLPAGVGTYRGTGQVMTPGTWDVTVTITKAGQQIAARRFSVIAK
jgi:RND family efflux transporter MFP subunit